MRLCRDLAKERLIVTALNAALGWAGGGVLLGPKLLGDGVGDYLIKSEIPACVGGRLGVVCGRSGRGLSAGPNGAPTNSHHRSGSAGCPPVVSRDRFPGGGSRHAQSQIFSTRPIYDIRQFLAFAAFGSRRKPRLEANAVALRRAGDEGLAADPIPRDLSRAAPGSACGS